MKEFSYVIKDEIGIHARPAGMLAKTAKVFTSKVTITANGKTVEATKQGTEVIIRAEGADEDAAIVMLKEFMNTNL